MFKGILSSKRVVSSEFTLVTDFMDPGVNGKENQPGVVPPNKGLKNSRPPTGKGPMEPYEKKKRMETKEKDQPIQGVGMNQAFDRLLDDLQIPPTLRPKLATMDSTVKAAMIKSSQTMALTPKRPASPPHTPRPTLLRKTRSSESLGSPRPAFVADLRYDVGRPPQTAHVGPGGLVFAHHASSVGSSNSPRLPSGHTRGASFDVPRTLSRTDVSVPAGVPSDFVAGKPGKEKGSTLAKNISPTRFCSILSGTSSTQLDVENVKKLRLLLRNESASWSQEFLRLGGYAALLTRLNEILEVEWREEQHDDQILHELLRCFKALSTSSIGCFALRSSCPTPFVQLVALLYSDKKPGEIGTRQLVVDLLLILFELYPPSSVPSVGNSNAYNSGRARSRREAWETESTFLTPSKLITLPSPHKTVYGLVRALILTPAPPPCESPAAPVSPHAFIECLHRPRIYKTYLQELSDVCRDYFWVFCHPNNTIWMLSETDEGRVEKPRAPGGMTGGVEFEAMGYFTTHLRLINAIAEAAAGLKLTKEHEDSAYRFHSDLFLSGLERIILISRKASTTYYPTLHLELARYIGHAMGAGYELPWTVSRLMGKPPGGLCKNGSSSPGGQLRMKGGVRGGMVLPSPKKMEPLKMDEVM